MVAFLLHERRETLDSPLPSSASDPPARVSAHFRICLAETRSLLSVDDEDFRDCSICPRCWSRQGRNQPHRHRTRQRQRHGNATAGIQYICYPEGRWQDQEFWQHEKGHELFFCTTFRESSGKPWAMLNSYRSGGKEGVHWKYTSDPNDIGCLLDWTYHSKDGNTVIERVKGRTTLAGDTKRWCGLPVYRSDGVRGKQWDFCSQC